MTDLATEEQQLDAAIEKLDTAITATLEALKAAGLEADYESWSREDGAVVVKHPNGVKLQLEMNYVSALEDLLPDVDINEIDEKVHS